MLKVTVTLIPGGVGAERKLGELVIANVDGGPHANYKCVLTSDDIPEAKQAVVANYPRWSASVWDLVARALAASLNDGAERLPRRPRPTKVPIHHDDGLAYVRMHEIPEPVRHIFARRMQHSTKPVIPGEGDCVYAWDWLDFLKGFR